MECAAQDKKDDPESQTSDECGQSPAASGGSGDAVEPLVPVKKRTGNKEDDILREIAKLHVAEGGPHRPVNADQKSRCCDEQDKEDDLRRAGEGACRIGF